jgi:hypothetical protein
LRQLVTRTAVEHANWIKFIAESASLLRASPSPWRKADPEVARRYAAAFEKYGAFLRGLTVPSYCVPLHRYACAWLESLETLSAAIGPTVEAGDPNELDALVRKSSEAQIRLRTFQRMHARTIEGIKKLFQDRPRPVPKPTQRRTPTAGARAR